MVKMLSLLSIALLPLLPLSFLTSEDFYQIKVDVSVRKNGDLFVAVNSSKKLKGYNLSLYRKNKDGKLLFLPLKQNHLNVIRFRNKKPLPIEAIPLDEGEI